MECRASVLDNVVCLRATALDVSNMVIGYFSVLSGVGADVGEGRV